nr:hypothetical protein [uncultured Carboxylicivirga sp.]
MKEAIRDRFIEYCESKNIRQIDLIEKGLGSKQTINFIWNGKQKPTLEFLSRFLTFYSDINARWLLTGEEVMISSSFTNDKEESSTLQMVTNDGEQVCIKCAQKDGKISLLEEELKKLVDRLEKQSEEMGRLKEKLKE